MKFRLIHADVIDGLRTLSDASVQCAVTSPPYWGLRDYGLPPSVWGGDAAHKHEWGPSGRKGGGAHRHTASSQQNGVGQMAAHEAISGASTGAFCPCGAWRGCLGLEPTPELFVEHIVTVFRELRRVLRDDGTLWLNLGDSYTSGGRDYRDPGKSQMNGGGRVAGLTEKGTRPDVPSGMKPKDLVGIPWMVAFALRADGWYLRSEIIWHKPNPMPESVTDRPTKAHETLFLLTKSAKYFYDADAIAEPASGFSTRNKRSVWTIATEPFPEAHFATFPSALVEPCILAGSKAGDTILDPFNGSGTAGVVALGLRRDYVGVELNPEYVAMSRRRLEGVAPMFTEEVTA